MKFLGQYQVNDEVGFPMAPMVDVIFLLLIFFVSTSVFYRLEAEMDIVIPSAEEATTSERRSGEIIVNVKKDGTLIVNQRQLTVVELTEILKQVSSIHEGQAVIVRGDGNTRFQDIMNVMDACSKAGIWNVSFPAMKEVAATIPE